MDRCLSRGTSWCPTARKLLSAISTLKTRGSDPDSERVSMEPLSALGLAANVAQLLDMGISVVRHTKEIADAGSTISAAHLSNLADDIESVSSSLTKSLKFASRAPENLSPEEKVGCVLPATNYSSFSPSTSIPFYLLFLIHLDRQCPLLNSLPGFT